MAVVTSEAKEKTPTRLDEVLSLEATPRVEAIRQTRRPHFTRRYSPIGSHG